MALTKQFTFIPNTTISADEVNANFDDIVGYLNTSVAPLDGPAFTGLPTVSIDPTSDTHLARKAYVDAVAVFNVNVLKALIPQVKIGTFDGTTDSSGSVSFSHGLGESPSSALLTVNGTSGGTAFGGAGATAVISGANSSILIVKFFGPTGDAFGAGVHVKLHWLVYGGHGV